MGAQLQPAYDVGYIVKDRDSSFKKAMKISGRYKCGRSTCTSFLLNECSGYCYYGKVGSRVKNICEILIIVIRSTRIRQGSTGARSFL